jgi:thioester reductase-like protein
VVCIVRARDGADAAARVRRALTRHGAALPRDRVRILAGDLALPRFGLDERAWEVLAGEVSAILHAAARVDGALPYEVLRRDNVEATREVLRFSRCGRPKALHHVSTLSVLSQAERAQGPDVDGGPLDALPDIYRGPQKLLGGYAQSKWAAEHLVRASGAPATVIRVGLLVPGDHLARFFRGLRDLGGAPSPRRRLELDVTPVREAATAILQRATPAGAEARATFHVCAPEPATIEDLLDAARIAGAPIADVPQQQWSRFFGRAPKKSADAAVAFLSLCRCLGEEGLARHRGLDLFEATGLRFGGIAGFRPPTEVLAQAAREALSSS